MARNNSGQELEQVQLSIEMLRATVTHVENLAGLLGTAQDNKILRAELSAAMKEVTELDDSISKRLSKVKSRDGVCILYFCVITFFVSFDF